MSAKARSDGLVRTTLRCAMNALSAVCFGMLLMLTLAPPLLNPQSVRALGGGGKGSLELMARGLSMPLAGAGVVLAVLGGTLSNSRRERNLAAAVAGLLGAFAVFHAAGIM